MIEPSSIFLDLVFLHHYLRKVTHSHISFLNYWAWVNTPLTGITASERGTSVSAWHFDFGIFTHTSFQICSSFVKFLLRVVILFQSNWHSETDSLKILARISFGSVSQSVPLLPVCATQKHLHSMKLLPLCFTAVIPPKEYSSIIRFFLPFCSPVALSQFVS